MWLATRIPPGAAHVERRRERGVVAGVDVEAVDRHQLIRVGLLDGRHVLDLGELGEQVRRHVRGCAAGDVVEDHRFVGGRRDRLVVAAQAQPARPVVVGGDRQHRVRAELGRALGQLHGLGRVVGAGAGDDALAGRALGDGELDQPELLVFGQRRGLAGGAGDDEAVGAVLREVPHQRDEGLLVDRAVAVEGGHYRRQDGAEVAHRLQYLILGSFRTAGSLRDAGRWVRCLSPAGSRRSPARRPLSGPCRTARAA